MRCTLYIQRDKVGRQIDRPTPLDRSVIVHKNGEAVALSGGKITDTLSRAKIEFIADCGIFISGVEELHNALIYQEWWMLVEWGGIKMYKNYNDINTILDYFIAKSIYGLYKKEEGLHYSTSEALVLKLIDHIGISLSPIYTQYETLWRAYKGNVEVIDREILMAVCLLAYKLYSEEGNE